jgi:hypothetical protein
MTSFAIAKIQIAQAKIEVFFRVWVRKPVVLSHSKGIIAAAPRKENGLIDYDPDRTLPKTVAIC